ncbi:MAG: hypothetical protein ACWA5L_07120 [bacterium]
MFRKIKILGTCLILAFAALVTACETTGEQMAGSSLELSGR